MELRRIEVDLGSEVLVTVRLLSVDRLFVSIFGDPVQLNFFLIHKINERTKNDEKK